MNDRKEDQAQMKRFLEEKGQGIKKRRSSEDEDFSINHGNLNLIKNDLHA